jgi:transposase
LIATDRRRQVRQVFERIFERVAGLDVHKAQVTAAVRVPDGRGGRLQDVAEFATTVQGLLALRDWLEALGVKQVAMEATGVYWKPVVRHEALLDRVG